MNSAINRSYLFGDPDDIESFSRHFSAIESIYLPSRYQLIQQPDANTAYSFQEQIQDGLHKLTLLRHQIDSNTEQRYEKLNNIQKLFYEIYPLIFCQEEQRTAWHQDRPLNSSTLQMLRSFDNALIEVQKLDQWKKISEGYRQIFEDDRRSFRMFCEAISSISRHKSAFSGKHDPYGFAEICESIIQQLETPNAIRPQFIGIQNLHITNPQNCHGLFYNFSDESASIAESFLRPSKMMPENLYDSIIYNPEKILATEGFSELNATIIALTLPDENSDIYYCSPKWEFTHPILGWSSQMNRFDIRPPFPMSRISSEKLLASIEIAKKSLPIFSKKKFFFDKYLECIYCQHGINRSIVDSVTCFETLFSDGYEISKIASLCVAKIIGRNIEDRKEIHSNMVEIFKQRNFIVHGNKSIAKPNDLYELAKVSHKYLASLIKKILLEFPKIFELKPADQIKNILLE